MITTDLDKLAYKIFATQNKLNDFSIYLFMKFHKNEINNKYYKQAKIFLRKDYNDRNL